MTKKSVFRGAATALITPTTENGVDFEAFGRLIDWQIEKGINALVIAGTTGEGSTLTDEEHKAVLKYAVERAAGRTPIIAGTGSNETDYAIELTRYASDIGADGMLVVTPYYNKATQKGLVKMYETIADASEKPIILYNVPSRTGVSIAPTTYLALSEHPMISGIKEANGNISAIAETFRLVGDKLDIYSGNDDQIVPIMSLGGAGVISVFSNIMPAEAVKLCSLALEGKFREAAAMQLQYLQLMNSMFSEVNPIPVKSAMAKMGFCENFLRLPLTTMEPEHEAVMFNLMRQHGLIQ